MSSIGKGIIQAPEHLYYTQGSLRDRLEISPPGGDTAPIAEIAPSRLSRVITFLPSHRTVPVLMKDKQGNLLHQASPLAFLTSLKASAHLDVESAISATE